jgi:heat shock protein HslJ
MKRNMLVFGLALMLGALILGGCDAGERSADLAGTQWVLTSLNGKAPMEDTEITLRFEKEFLSGSMGCNNYGGGRDSGKYSRTDRGMLKVRQLAVTVQLCSEPEGIMEQEEAYIDALLSAETYRVIEDRLEIAYASGATPLVFAGK